MNPMTTDLDPTPESILDLVYAIGSFPPGGWRLPNGADTGRIASEKVSVPAAVLADLLERAVLSTAADFDEPDERPEIAVALACLKTQAPATFAAWAGGPYSSFAPDDERAAWLAAAAEHQRGRDLAALTRLLAEHETTGAPDVL